MQWWKTFEKPATRIAMVLGTHNLKIAGATASRRLHGTTLALIMARRRRGLNLPPLVAD